MTRKVVEINWLRDHTFDAVAEGRHLTLDSGHGRGLSPVELALISLGGCTAIDVISILQKARQDVTDLKIRVEGERAEEHPRRYTRIEMIYEVQGRGLNPATVERAVALSEEKYCSVSATFKEHCEIGTRIELVELGEGG